MPLSPPSFGILRLLDSTQYKLNLIYVSHITLYFQKHKNTKKLKQFKKPIPCVACELNTVGRELRV